MKLLIYTFLHLIFFTNPTFSSVSREEGLGLKELIAYGLKHSPVIQSAQSELEIVKLDQEDAFSAFLPKLDLSANYGYQDGDPSFSDDKWGTTVSLKLIETLYNNGANFTQYELSKLNLKKAKLQFQKERDIYCLTIVKLWHSFLKNRELYKIQRFQHEILFQQFQLTENKYKRGEETRRDYLRFKARLQRSELSLKRSENVLRKIKEEIKNEINYESSKSLLTLKEENEIEEIVSPIEINIDKILKFHIDHKNYELEEKINNLKVELVKLKYFPEISLSVGVDYSYSEPSTSLASSSSLNQTDWSALITLSYNLLDWGIKKRALSVSRIKKEISINNNKSKLNELRLELSKLSIDIQQNKDNYLLTKELKSLEKRNYQLLLNDYRNGRSSYLDLVSGVENLVSAEEDFYSNYFDLKNVIFDFYFHKGVLYEILVKK